MIENIEAFQNENEYISIKVNNCKCKCTTRFRDVHICLNGSWHIKQSFNDNHSFCNSFEFLCEMEKIKNLRPYERNIKCTESENNLGKKNGMFSISSAPSSNATFSPKKKRHNNKHTRNNFVISQSPSKSTNKSRFLGSPKFNPSQDSFESDTKIDNEEEFSLTLVNRRKLMDIAGENFSMLKELTLSGSIESNETISLQEMEHKEEKHCNNTTTYSEGKTEEVQVDRNHLDPNLFSENDVISCKNNENCRKEKVNNNMGVMCDSLSESLLFEASKKTDGSNSPRKRKKYKMNKFESRPSLTTDMTGNQLCEAEEVLSADAVFENCVDDSSSKDSVTPKKRKKLNSGSNTVTDKELNLSGYDSPTNNCDTDTTDIDNVQKMENICVKKGKEINSKNIKDSSYFSHIELIANQENNHEDSNISRESHSSWNACGKNKIKPSSSPAKLDLGKKEKKLAQKEENSNTTESEANPNLKYKPQNSDCDRFSEEFISPPVKNHCDFSTNSTKHKKTYLLSSSSETELSSNTSSTPAKLADKIKKVSNFKIQSKLNFVKANKNNTLDEIDQKENSKEKSKFLSTVESDNLCKTKPMLVSSTPFPKSKKIKKTMQVPGECSTSDASFNAITDESSLSNFESMLEEIQCKLIAHESELQAIKNLKIVIDWKLSPLHKIDSGSSRLTMKKIRDNLGPKHSKLLNESKFTIEEENTVQKTWEEFAEKYHFSDPELFFPSTQNFGYFSLKERHNFKLFLAKDLPTRRLLSVYQKFVKLYAVKKKGRWTDKEDRLLLDIYNFCKKKEVYPDSDEEIPTETKLGLTMKSVMTKSLNRSLHSVDARLKILLENKNGYSLTQDSILWTGDLEGALVHRLTKRAKVNSLEDLRHATIPYKVWRKVVSKLDIPLEIAVNRWKYHLYPQLFARQPVLRNILQVELIKWFYKSDIKDFKSVDWNDLSRRAGDLGSCYLYRMFATMVKNWVPKEFSKNFRESVVFLHEHNLPQLEKRKTSRLLVRKIFDPDTRTVEVIEEDEEDCIPYKIE